MAYINNNNSLDIIDAIQSKYRFRDNKRKKFIKAYDRIKNELFIRSLKKITYDKKNRHDFFVIVKILLSLNKKYDICNFIIEKDTRQLISKEGINKLNSLLIKLKKELDDRYLVKKTYYIIVNKYYIYTHDEKYRLAVMDYMNEPTTENKMIVVNIENQYVIQASKALKFEKKSLFNKMMHKK
jgi:hypothetical protein